MKIYISRQVVAGPWGGGNRWLRAFTTACHTEGWRIACSVADADVAMIAAVKPGSPAEPGAVQVAADARQRGIPPIFRVNDCNARKGTVDVDRDIKMAARYASHVVFVSRWLASYAAARGVTQRGCSVIANGVDKHIFNRTLHMQRKPADRLRIVTHHWSDNRLKGAAWYEMLDELSRDNDITLTYIGRHACNFSDRTIVIPPCDGEQLAAAIAQNDVYVSGSVNDPGPNHIIEAVALGMPMIVSTQGGGCVEFAAPAPAITTLDELAIAIMNGHAVVSNMAISSWETCAATYVKLIKDIANGNAG